jgi:CHAT domain-containing protein
MGSESQRMAHLENMRGFLHVFLSLARQECLQSESTTRSAMGFVLRRKAIGAEALAAQRDAVLGGNYPALRERLEQFRMLTYEITRETLAGPGAKEIDEYQQDLNTLNIKKEQLEAELARQIPEMDLEQQLRTADYRAIAHHLPNDTALVEFIRFYQYNFTTVPAVNRIYWSPPHYLAFVLHARAQDSVIMIDLGNADLIDHMVVDFRASITHRGQMRGEDASDEEVLAGAAPEGTELRAAVFDLLVTHLDGSTRVIFAPDGELTRLPFEVLPTDDGRRLIDTYHFSYLSIGRDALRFGYKAMHDPTAPVVIANPDYNLGSSDSLAEGDENTSVQGLRDEVRSPVTSPASADIASANGPPFITAELSERHSRDLPKAIKRIDRLPNVEAEGREIGKLLNVDPWLRENALEGLLKATKSPRILHIATHGFFIENQRIATPTRVQASGFADHILSRISASGIENPLLRSGLVLAGVNTFLAGGLLSQDAEDGVLTALDVSSLDLLSTDLAVLSACETGLGDVQTGEGVFGLRRAFMLAGAKTLVMSLWKVPDEATKELMVDFYRRVLAGEGRADALRKAQLAIKAKHPDPYYWGAFICQGDPSPLPDASGKHT